MRGDRLTHKRKVISSYLTLAFIYLMVFVPIFLFYSKSLILQTVHIFDLAICIWANSYLKKTNRTGLPSVALCIIAYLTVIAVMITGGYAGSGPFLVFAYVPFVAFLSGTRKGGLNWLLAMLLTMCGILILEVTKVISIDMKPVTFALYIFIYLLTILLLDSYMQEKEFSDNEVSQKSMALDRKNKILRQTNEAKDNFILLASHQLRTPATAVKLYLDMLLSGFAGKLTKNQLEFTKTGYDSNERQLRIVDDLLLVAQLDAGKIRLQRRPTDLSLLIGGIIAEQQLVFQSRNQTVKQRYPDKLPLINIDGERLRMAIANLTDNASKYSPPGRKISVEVSEGKSTVSIAVTDEGVGINKQDRQKLFKKFSRIDNPLSIEVGGSGLGLYWAKKVTELHDGKLLVRSRIGRGSTFEIKLPIKKNRVK